MYFRIFSTWRLIAALVVMIYHFAHYGPESARTVIERLERLLPLLDMFFMISGILIFTHYRDSVSTAREYRDYIARRFARIYPLHLATLMFFVAVALAGKFGLVKTHDIARYDLSQVLPNLLLVQAWGFSKELSLNYVSWSLSAEWLCYLLLPVIVIAFRRGGATGLLVLFSVYLVLLETLTHFRIVPFPHWLMADTWGAWRALADFIIGATVAALAHESRFSLKSHWPAWLTMLASIVALQLKLSPYVGYYLIVLALFLAAVCERNTPERAEWLDMFKPAATVSFGIYMWHPVVETVIYFGLWPRFPAASGVNFYIFMIIPVLFTIALARLSSNTFEKWAGRRIAVLFGAGRPAPRPAAAE